MDFKRNIEEIIAIYDLEDSVKDIYVEGGSDKSFFQWVIGCGAESNSESEIYAVEDIYVPDELLDKYGLEKGSNRNRVIAASIAIAEALPDSNNSMFIVDRDYSNYIEERINSHLINFTDYNSLELYALNEEVIRKLMALVYGRFSSKLPDFYFDMEQILRSLYAIRLTNIVLKWNLTWLDFKKYVTVNQSIEFKEEKYIDAYLNKNSKLNEREYFYDALAKNKESLESDCRLSCRGHDFTALLMHIMNKKFPAKKVERLDVFEGFVMGLIDKEDIISEKLIGDVYDFSGCS